MAIRKITPLFLIVSLVVTWSAAAQVTVHGVVRDGETGEAIVLANVWAVGTDIGAATNERGVFTFKLPVGRHRLIVTALGYNNYEAGIETRGDTVAVEVTLKPAILLHHEVMVEGVRTKSDELATNPSLNSTEDLMDHIPGVDFIERANYAWEPVIRGMGGGQVGMVIDGVKVIGACVDKMDPTSSYVEVENLQKLELSKGGFDLSKSSQIGGTVNMVTEKPTFNRSFYASAETAVESAAQLRRVRGVAGGMIGNTSVRGSFSFKRADDFTPGNGVAIPYSGYTKNNFKLDASQRLRHSHSLTASFLADNAWKIGYPVLLMDATLAKARIYSLTHNWTSADGSGFLQAAESKVYTNTVNHWMDDYSRNVDERQVMRSMNMPMYGSTRTSGAIGSYSAKSGQHSITLTLDGYRTSSFGDMWMFSTLPNIPDMYLLNLGDVVVNNGAVALEHSVQIGPKLRTHLSARADYSIRDVEDDRARSILGGRWGADNLRQTYFVPNASGTLEYAIAPSTLIRFSLADVGRLPTHVENYGHYIYNYVDGYFYSGNPTLKPERSRQMEIGFERLTANYGVRVNAFYNHVSNYILGTTDDGLVDGNTSYRFRMYANIDAATLLGFELSGIYSLLPTLEARAATSYTRGHNIEYDEPLPLIPPLSGSVGLAYTNANSWRVELEARGAAPQNRVSRRAAREDGTDGYAILNFRANYPVSENFELKAGVDNVFDAYYNEHLAFGNLPSLGRNFFAALSVEL